VGSRSFDFNEGFYNSAVKAVGALSRLFSESELPFFHYRFVENLFVRATNGKNISRQDAVFDALVGEDFQIGVGVKTFTIAGKSGYSYEKVQEFTAIAGRGEFAKLSDKALILAVAKERNRRIDTESANFNLDQAKSIYHCLVRQEGQAFVHEEPYEKITIDKISPLNRSGVRVPTYAKRTANVHFEDDKHKYRFSRSKNVLLKKFDLTHGENFDPIAININNDAFTKLYEEFIGAELLSNEPIDAKTLVAEPIPGIDYVILPLYSTKSDPKTVPEKSGLNQWNASGRQRKYGETYIPVPKKIHQLCPNFFPGPNTFNLYLPGEKMPVMASLCQDELKALMSNPNDQLCKWIFRVIDAEFSEYDFNRPPKRKPFTYDELAASGYDSVRVSKKKASHSGSYEIWFEPVDSYEEFIGLLEGQG
jgi:hypothetical protein